MFKKNRDYSVVLSKLVKAQIEKNPDDYFIEDYKGVDPQQPFYIDEEALYLVFNVYDIAPYVMGFPTFKIPFKEIEPIIDKNGSFWLAFHRQAVP
ncbi:RsiV family protein [Bacillus sp. JCM 19041]|uniref:RsiV family protein n=1 Tax=Bacillus sp. JCM 19041 TaxID=1460637 RepID=UPI0006D0D413